MLSISSDPIALDTAIEPVSKRRAGVPAELDAIVTALLARAPADRPRDAAEVRSLLLALVGDAAPYPRGEPLLAACVRTRLAP